LWGGFSVRDADFNLPQHRHDLLWLVPLDWHDPLFLQVDSLSFHLVQISPVTSTALIAVVYLFRDTMLKLIHSENLEYKELTQAA
jgi:hypothetical protein